MIPTGMKGILYSTYEEFDISDEAADEIKKLGGVVFHYEDERVVCERDDPIAIKLFLENGSEWFSANHEYVDIVFIDERFDYKIETVYENTYKPHKMYEREKVSYDLKQDDILQELRTLINADPILKTQMNTLKETNKLSDNLKLVLEDIKPLKMLEYWRYKNEFKEVP